VTGNNMPANDYVYWNGPRKITPKKVNKGWGYELHIANFIGEHLPEIKEKGYCLKLLVFNKEAMGSMHFHSLKHEVFYVGAGTFKIFFIDPRTAEEFVWDLKEGEAVVIPQNNPHRITTTEAGFIVEASTPDRPEDSYRVGKGDSQK